MRAVEIKRPGEMALIDAPVLIMSAAALLYEHPSDKGWQEIKDTHTPEKILARICGLPEGSRLSRAIMTEYGRLSDYMKNGGSLV